MKAKTLPPLFDALNHMEDLPKLRREKERLQKDIQSLEAMKESLKKEAEVCLEHMNQIGNETRRTVYERGVIDHQRKTLSDLEDYFIDEPTVIHENIRQWAILADELKASGRKIEEWLRGPAF